MSVVLFYCFYANRSINKVPATPSTISPARMKHITFTNILFFML